MPRQHPLDPHQRHIHPGVQCDRPGWLQLCQRLPWHCGLCSLQEAAAERVRQVMGEGVSGICTELATCAHSSVTLEFCLTMNSTCMLDACEF